MVSILLKKISEHPVLAAGTAVGVAAVIVLTIVHLSYEIRIKKIQLENLKKTS